MVGLENPCNKCLVQASCNRSCDNYKKYDKKFNFFFSNTSMTAIFLLITILTFSYLSVFKPISDSSFQFILLAYFVINIIVSVLAFLVSKENNNDHNYTWMSVILIILVGIPTILAILISDYLDKFNRCAAYK